MPMAGFSVFKNLQVFEQFLKLANRYLPSLVSMKHGVRSHMAFITAVGCDLRVQDKRYLALRDVWESSLEDDESFEALKDEWEGMARQTEDPIIQAALRPDQHTARCFAEQIKIKKEQDESCSCQSGSGVACRSVKLVLDFGAVVAHLSALGRRLKNFRATKDMLLDLITPY